MSIFLNIFLVLPVFTFLMLFAYRRLANRMDFLDYPNERSSHNNPIPLGAGVVFFVCFVPAISTLLFYGMISSKVYFVLIIGSFVYTFLGFADDLKNLAAWKRLIPQFVIASWVLLQLTSFLEIPFIVKFLPIDSQILAFIFGVLFVAWMVNLFNFMDGLDGFLGTNALVYSVLSFVLCVLQGNMRFGFIYLLLTFIILPFLFFNWRPAKVFMGDAGAYFLGFFFASQGLVGKIDFELSLVAQIILMGALISDATQTLIFRLITTGRVFQGHQTHGFQRLRLDYKWRTTRVVSTYIGMTVFWFFPWSVLAVMNPDYSVAFCFISYLPVLVLLFFLRAGWGKALGKQKAYQ